MVLASKDALSPTQCAGWTMCPSLRIRRNTGSACIKSDWGVAGCGSMGLPMAQTLRVFGHGWQAEG